MDSGNENQEELLAYNRKMKKAVMDVLFRETETFYVHCLPNPALSIGKRGLVEKEKTDGIILVFGPYSTRHLSWDHRLIYCEMQFSKWEQVTIPYECVARMFDKTGQVDMRWATMVDPEGIEVPGRPALTVTSGEARDTSDKTTPEERTEPGKDAADRETPEADKDGRVIEVDFRKRTRE